MKPQHQAMIYSLLTASVITVLAGCGGPAGLGSAQKAYERREYFLSADLYRKAYGTSKEKEARAEAAFGAAESYFHLNDYDNAERWYSQVLKQDPDRGDALFQLALVLKSEERYEEAIGKLEECVSKGVRVEEARLELEGSRLALIWKKEKTRYMVVNEKGLNTRSSDFAAVNVKNKEIYFTSDREFKGNSKMYNRTGDRYLALYRAEIKRGREKEAEGSPLKIRNQEIPTDLHFQYNEGVCSFNQNTIFFTLCNGADGKENTCRIYSARINGKGFSDVTPLPFCKDSLTNYGHPAISQDGQTLYFSADLPGGFGGKDIYYTRYDRKKQSWSEPVNAGATVNTQKDEMYPFLHPDGTLYFSSNGHAGMGGLDIYFSTGSGNEWEKPVNMKSPVNSGADDFAITLDASRGTGYFSSNRKGGLGKDDIYSFYLKPLVFNLTVLVKDSKTGQPVTEALLRFTIEGDSTVELKTNSNGELKVPLRHKTAYRFMASKTEDYYLDSEEAAVSTQNLEVSEDFSRVLLLTPINVEDEFTLKGIYYDLDKSDLRAESMPVLDSLITLLSRYPKIRIEIGSHTDCRATMSYNETLSQQRAQAVVDYLIKKGIPSTRLVAKGYGESRLVNDCACEDGVAKRKCSEEEHQLNRRTTFRILSK